MLLNISPSILCWILCWILWPALFAGLKQTLNNSFTCLCCCVWNYFSFTVLLLSGSVWRAEAPSWAHRKSESTTPLVFHVNCYIQLYISHCVICPSTKTLNPLHWNFCFLAFLLLLGDFCSTVAALWLMGIPRRQLPSLVKGLSFLHCQVLLLYYVHCGTASGKRP